METLTKSIEQMSGSLAEPDMQERASAWMERSAKETRQEEKAKEGKYGPRVIELEGKPEAEREFFEAAAERDESAKAAEPRDAKPAASEPANARGAPKEQGKLTQMELDNYLRSAGGNPEWQKAVSPHLAKALGEVENAKEVVEHLASHPEVMRNVTNVNQLRDAVHQISDQKSMGEMLKEATVRYPDAGAKIRSATNEIVGKAPTFMQVFINDSEVIGDLLYTLADATTLSNLLEMSKTNPGKCLRVLHSMELDIQKALSNRKATDARPRAPRPPREVGGRSAATDDDTRGMDFTHFSRTMERRHMQAR